jgi:hypothetical protein
LQHAPGQPQIDVHELHAERAQRHLAARPELDAAPVQRREERGPVGSDQVDHAELQGLGGRGRAALAHGIHGEPNVAAALLGDRLGVRGRVVDDLAGDVAPLEVDRRRRSDRRPRRHRRHVRGERDDGPGRSGPGTLGGNEDDHVDPGVQEGLRDVAHRCVQPAGRVELDEQSLVPLALRTLERLAHVVGEDRGDRAVDRDHEDAGRLGRRPARGISEQEEGREREQEQRPTGR